MKRFLQIFFIACFLGCYFEPPEPPETELFYINNSGVSIKMTVIIEDDDYPNYSYTRYMQEIKNNDTLCNPWRINNRYYFKIEFLSEPKTCLIFDGAAEIGDYDIRYFENYALMREENMRIIYSYTITPEHKDMAKEEHCEE